MYLVYSLKPEIAQNECNWLADHLPEVNPRYWHAQYSDISGKYIFTVILKKGQEHITKMILDKYGEANFDVVRPKPTGLVTCFPNH